jgi:hypothetical protein
MACGLLHVICRVALSMVKYFWSLLPRQLLDPAWEALDVAVAALVLFW